MKKYLFFLIIPVIVFAQSVFNPLPTAPISIFGIPLMQKGSILVSDGFFLGEKLACADNDILVYDALETDGLGCQPIPVDTNTNAATLCNSGEYLDGDGTCQTVPVGVITTECQTKTLSANTNAIGQINDLTFNNLDTLKNYSFTLKANSEQNTTTTNDKYVYLNTNDASLSADFQRVTSNTARFSHAIYIPLFQPRKITNL